MNLEAGDDDGQRPDAGIAALSLWGHRPTDPVPREGRYDSPREGHASRVARPPAWHDLARTLALAPRGRFRRGRPKVLCYTPPRPEVGHEQPTPAVEPTRAT